MRPVAALLLFVRVPVGVVVVVVVAVVAPVAETGPDVDSVVVAGPEERREAEEARAGWARRRATTAAGVTV